ncbi:MAG TPA: 50S ribosomal protein L29 [Steroidobacteraceae bacterium]|jgi:large subunit ribosomal protein L29|nr:50S ribosomal protein L29 [Steroidobacteraceae bacterium]
MAARKKKAAAEAAPATTPKAKRQNAPDETLVKWRAASAADLHDELLKLRKEQFALRLQRATGQAVKPDQFGKVRKNIARLKTIAREAQLAAAAGVKK